MKTCGDRCVEMCNHCTHQVGPSDGGRCKLTGEVVDPQDLCDDFECWLIAAAGTAAGTPPADANSEPQKLD